MDPNVTLENLRKLVSKALALSEAEATCAADAAMQNITAAETLSEMTELVEALDTWLTNGGFLPDAWNKRQAPTEHEKPRITGGPIPASGINLAGFKADLELFIDKNRCFDTKIYTAEEWATRRESVGQKAMLTVISEGGSGLIARAEFGYAFDKAFDRKLKALCEKYKVYGELGYSWSMHFYPKWK